MEDGEHHTFKVNPEGPGYICCFCDKAQSRLPTHLTSKNSPCQGRITSMSTFSSSFKSFSAKMRQAKFKESNPGDEAKRYQKHKESNPGDEAKRYKKHKESNPGDEAKRRAEYVKRNPEAAEASATNFKESRPGDEARRYQKHKEGRPGDEAKRQKLCRAGRSSNDMVKKFQEVTMYSCIFVCSCCHLRKFRNQVHLIDDKLNDTITKKAPTAMKECIYPEDCEELPADLLVDIGKGPQAWLCNTCKKYLLKSKMPPNCHKNNLEVKPSWQDNQDTKLTQLEAHLISRNIQFQFIRPKGRSR